MYEVSYAPRVLDTIRQMILPNPAHAAELITALRELEQRLRVYPQFGQPLRDLSVRPAQLWIGVVPPLVLHYVLNEDQRRVMVVRSPIPLPHTGIV
jgi:hypothetical protein